MTTSNYCMRSERLCLFKRFDSAISATEIEIT